MTKLDLTAGGKLTVPPMVSNSSIAKVTEMVSEAKRGGHEGDRARINLAESLSTSDAPFSFAHLVNLRNLPIYEEAEDSLDPITQDETVPDFRPATFANLQFNFEGLEYGKDTDGERVAPRVAEGDTYQYAFGYTQEDTSIAVEKRGFKVGWTLEQAVNDPFGLVNRFPNDMLAVGRKTDEYVRIRALKNGVTSASALQAGEDFVSEEAVTVNNAPTPAALRVAIRQIGQRTDSDGVRIAIPRNFYLVVGRGMSESIEWALGLAKGAFQIQDGLVTSRIPSAPADPINRISGIIESQFVEDGAWYLVPAAGTTDRPALVRVRLAGWETPEVYVNNFTGLPLAGGASNSPFRAFHLDNDTIDLKYRMIVNAGLFSEDAIVWSDGTGE